MELNRFFKNTLGIFAEVLIAAKLNDTNTAAPEATYADFIANADAGDVAAYWEDDETVLVTGDVATAANATRKFFYAFKQADGVSNRTTGIVAGTVKYSSQAYSAGTAQVETTTFGGTIAATQIVHVKVIEITPTTTPFPFWMYQATVGSGGINAAITAIRTDINAEADGMVAATGATNVLILTSTDKTRTFKVTAYIETSPSQQVDDSAITIAHTTAAVKPVGTTAQIRELEAIARTNGGGIVYTYGGYTAEEFGVPSSNVDNATQYGILLVAHDASELGVMETATKRKYTIVVLQTADHATIAAY